MRLRVWGCRGSLAAPGPDTVRYGGNTSCVEVRLDDGTIIVLDVGTGARPLGIALEQEDVREVHILLSHLHMDHLQGLGFFRPLFDPTVTVHIWGPSSPVASLDARIAAYLSPPLFPVSLAQIPARLSFHDAPDDGAFDVGGATVRSTKVAHQGPTVGYRIEGDGRSLAYIPDHEPALGGIDLRRQDPAWVSGFELARDADVLLHDAQYTDEEYPRHVGWGHSCIDHVTAFAQLASVRQLVLFHHDPHHTDEDLDAVGAVAASLWGGIGGPPILATDGMELALTPSSAPAPASSIGGG